MKENIEENLGSPKKPEESRKRKLTGSFPVVITCASLIFTLGLMTHFIYDKSENKNLNIVNVDSITGKSTLEKNEIKKVIDKINDLGYQEVKNVKQSKLQDFYSIYSGGEVIYVNKDFSYSFYGDLIDNKEKVNLTKIDQKTFEVEKELSSMLNSQLSISDIYRKKISYDEIYKELEKDFIEKQNAKTERQKYSTYEEAKEKGHFGEKVDAEKDKRLEALLEEKRQRNIDNLEKVKALGVKMTSENNFESEALKVLKGQDQADEEPTFTPLDTKAASTPIAHKDTDIEEYRKEIRARIMKKMSEIGKPTTGLASSSHSNSSRVSGPVQKETINLSQIQDGNSTVTYKGKTVHKIGYSNEGVKLSKEEVVEQIKNMYKKVEATGEKWSVVYPAKGEEKAGVVIFSDPTCPVCKRLHRNIDKLNEAGLTVRVLMYPRALVYGMDDPSAQRSMEALEAIWCSADTAASMEKVYKGEAINVSDCSYVKEQGRSAFPASEHYFLGMLFNIKGTPLGFTNSGTLISGFSTVDSYLRRVGIK